MFQQEYPTNAQPSLQGEQVPWCNSNRHPGRDLLLSLLWRNLCRFLLAISLLRGVHICRENQMDVAFTPHNNTPFLGIQSEKGGATQKITTLLSFSGTPASD